MSSPAKITNVDSLTAQFNSVELDAESQAAGTDGPPQPIKNSTSAPTPVHRFSKQDAELLMALATLNGWCKDEKASDKEALESAAHNVSALRETLRGEKTAVAVEKLRNLDRDDPKAKYFKAEFERVLRELEVERAEQIGGGNGLGEKKEQMQSKADGEN